MAKNNNVWYVSPAIGSIISWQSERLRIETAVKLERSIKAPTWSDAKDYINENLLFLKRILCEWIDSKWLIYGDDWMDIDEKYFHWEIDVDHLYDVIAEAIDVILEDEVGHPILLYWDDRIYSFSYLWKTYYSIEKDNWEFHNQMFMDQTHFDEYIKKNNLIVSYDVMEVLWKINEMVILLLSKWYNASEIRDYVDSFLEWELWESYIIDPNMDIYEYFSYICFASAGLLNVWVKDFYENSYRALHSLCFNHKPWADFGYNEDFVGQINVIEDNVAFWKVSSFKSWADVDVYVDNNFDALSYYFGEYLTENKIIDISEWLYKNFPKSIFKWKISLDNLSLILEDLRDKLIENASSQIVVVFWKEFIRKFNIKGRSFYDIDWDRILDAENFEKYVKEFNIYYFHNISQVSLYINNIISRLFAGWLSKEKLMSFVLSYEKGVLKWWLDENYSYWEIDFDKYFQWVCWLELLSIDNKIFLETLIECLEVLEWNLLAH